MRAPTALYSFRHNIKKVFEILKRGVDRGREKSTKRRRGMYRVLGKSQENGNVRSR